MKGKSCRVLAAILLAMITLFSVGCDFNFTPTDDTKTTHTVSFVSEGKEISKTEVGNGRKVNKPKTPVRAGYRFKGWNFDFNKLIYNDTTIEAEWSYYSNASLQADSADEFICDFSMTEDAGGSILSYQDETLQKNVLRCQTEVATSKSAVEMEFGGIAFPSGSKLIILAKYTINGEDLVGAGIEMNGEWLMNFKESTAYEEYVISIEEETVISSLSFRPYSTKSTYIFDIAAFDILTNYENVDFSKNPQYVKGFVGEKGGIGELIYDETIGKTVLEYKTVQLGNDQYLHLMYGGLIVPAGTKIEVRFAYERNREIGGAEVYLNGDWKVNALTLDYTTYIINIDRELAVEIVSIRPSNPAALYTFKVESIKVILGS
jgi:hypothetical protein